MNNGYLSTYFESVAAKRLSAVEVDTQRSHQHEFNGTKELKSVIRTDERTEFETKFMWIEDQNAAVSEEGTVTWYDARENHPTRSEYRLYFPSNGVMSMAQVDDALFIGRRTDDTLLIVIVPSGSTIERQLYWLFGLQSPQGNLFEAKEISDAPEFEVDFAARFILEELEIDVEEPENDKIDKLIAKFGLTFPDTATFSDFARYTLETKYSTVEEPDNSLLVLMEWEEKLFRRLERSIVSKRLSDGFEEGEDVDGFIRYSLSVQNRRKSRAGAAFENHLAFIFENNKLTFTRKAETENKAKPDFLFPTIAAYRDAAFPTPGLTLLGVKTSCKDRWRQVLSESVRIERKHLLTLEPGISENQTAEMEANRVQLVLPQKLHSSYSTAQQGWLMNLQNFIGLVIERQRTYR
jgi:hypothetical protein